MTEYEIAVMYTEFKRDMEEVWEHGAGGDPYSHKPYYLPTEQECRELMESLLPDGWDYLKWFVPCTKEHFVLLYDRDVNDVDAEVTGDTPHQDTPSEAYLLAAQWLKEQQAPKNLMCITVTHGEHTVLQDAVCEHCKLDIGDGRFTINADGSEGEQVLTVPPAKFKVGDLVVSTAKHTKGVFAIVTWIKDAEIGCRWADTHEEVFEYDYNLTPLDEAITKLKEQS